ncbi:uncharacterized protein [Dendropsophus ebraccatus]|uniref:uncharacterized protein n=1 Tax=Dendropsophus ebraccatus TaxID=150705 RepID=UPI003831CE90
MCNIKLSDSYDKPLCRACTARVVQQESPSLLQQLKEAINEEVRSSVSAALNNQPAPIPISEPPAKRARRIIISDSDSEDVESVVVSVEGSSQQTRDPPVEEAKKFYFSLEDTDILLNAVRKAMDITDIEEQITKQDAMFAGLRPKRKRAFPVHESIKNMILDEWKEPEKRLFIPKEFRSRFPFEEEDTKLWLESPKIDIQVAKVVKKTSLPFEDASQLKDPIDRKMDSLLRRSWDASAAAINPNIAATTVARSLFLWLEELEKRIEDKTSREELLSSVPMLKLATAYLVDISAESVRFAAKAAALTNSSRRALWLKSWQGDNLSKTKLCAIPFEGTQVFGSVLDTILQQAADKKKDFPKDSAPKKKGNFRPYSQTQSRSYRGKGKTGWIINVEKSDLVPSHSKKFLGMILDTEQQMTFLPPTKVASLQEKFKAFTRKRSVTIREAMSLLGSMVSCMQAVPWCQSHSRTLQSQILRVWNRSPLSLDKKMSVSPQVKESLKWWCQETNLNKGCVWFPQQVVALTTDASRLGWGAHVQDLLFQGRWGELTRQNSSNFRELKAVYKALKAARDHLWHQHVKVYSDNATTVAFINHQGGTRHRPLQFLARKIFGWAELHLLSLSAVHLKGSQNIVADFLSRQEIHPGEWSLNPEVFQTLISKWGVPEVDLFATRKNTKVKRFFSLNPKEMPEAVDALNQRWTFNLAYAFPPLPLVARALQKILSGQTRVIFVAPLWPKRSWFSLLQHLRLEGPFRLPLREDLLLQGPLTHPGLHQLHLSAWLLRSPTLPTKDSHPR